MGRLSNLQRGLKSRHISLIALGGVVGSAYFLGTGYVLHELGPSTFIAYAIGALITLITMSCLIELTIANPSHGSFIEYIVDFISPSVGCAIGWSYWVSWVVFLPAECLAAGILIHHFLPAVSIPIWTISFGLFITFINLTSVKLFGEFEFYLAIIKIALITGFSIMATLIFFGLVGVHQSEFMGMRYLADAGGLFPNGFPVFLFTMVIVLSNYQGSEIVAMAATQSENPRKTAIFLIEKITLRVLGVYLIPTLLLSLIFPWQEASLAGSIFAMTLSRYGFYSFAHALNVFIIAGSVSCANSGLYATIRALYALAQLRIAPAFLKKVNDNQIPVNATLATLAVMWIVLLCTLFVPASQLYANLLATSGFACTFCWIAICIAQIRARRFKPRLKLPFRVPLSPYLPIAAILLQAACLAFVAFSPLRMSFFLGFLFLLVPMAVHKFWLGKRA